MPKYTGTTVQTQAITFAEPVALDTVNGDFTVTGVIVTNGTPSSSTHAVTKGYVDTSIANLVDSSPAALDTLNELAAALNDDSSFATTVNNSLALKAPIDNPTFTGTVAGVSKGMVGLGNADNTSDADKPVSTAQQTALDAKAPIASPTFTGTVSGVTKAMVGLSNADNTSDSNKPISTATQTALDLKAPINNPTFTGTVGGVTKSMVGLAQVDNTSDANKPISSATQTALNDKAPINNPTFTGSVGGVSASMVGLGNVTNESKSTMFSSPTFTGTVSGVTATHVGLGNVTNESKATMFNNPTFTGTVTGIPQSAANELSASSSVVMEDAVTVSQQVMLLGDSISFQEDVTLSQQSSRLLFGRIFAPEMPADTTFSITVGNPGDGNNYYYIDLVFRNTLTLTRGATYIFDQSDASNTNHPIAFKDGSGNSYTNGVTSSGTPGQSGAQTAFVVPSDAPDDLRYYCTVHGNSMGNTITVVHNDNQTISNNTSNSMSITGIGTISHGGILTTFPHSS